MLTLPNGGLHNGVEKIWFSHGSRDSCGTCILFSRKLQIDVHNVITDESGRFILLYVSMNKCKFVISSVYAPNRDSPEFFQYIFNEITRFSPDYRLILGGYEFRIR